jgi:hypothetical protein
VNTHFFFWTPLLAVAAHIFEEFVFPGSFASWYRRCRPDDPTITTRRLVVANSILAFFAVCAGLLGPTRYGMQVWLIVMGSLFANSIFHLRATLRMREYSPGSATSLLIYMPLTCFGVLWLVNNNMTTIGVAVPLLAVGACIMLWIDLRYYMARAFQSSK